MPALVANARMYAVTPAVREAWRALFDRVSRQSGVPLTVIDHTAPAPLEALWARDDLGLAFICGHPFARGSFEVQPVAAPIPSPPRYQGQPVYCTDLVVRADSGVATLADAFAGRIGWTVDHSHSGYHAVRHHLLAYCDGESGPLFGGSVGPLVTPRRVIEAVLSGEIDVGPLDSYVHDLLKEHEPETAAALRTLESTPMAPMPLLVAARAAPARQIDQLRSALLGAGSDPEVQPLLKVLLLKGFAAVDPASYGELVARARIADEAGYAAPA